MTGANLCYLFTLWERRTTPDPVLSRARSRFTSASPLTPEFLSPQIFSNNRANTRRFFSLFAWRRFSPIPSCFLDHRSYFKTFNKAAIMGVEDFNRMNTLSTMKIELLGPTQRLSRCLWGEVLKPPLMSSTGRKYSAAAARQIAPTSYWSRAMPVWQKPPFEGGCRKCDPLNTGRRYGSACISHTWSGTSSGAALMGKQKEAA